ncbi:UDP-2,4-diacetamido-2,4,6-trideoxy-beta-L-altropyranose hydrolase [Flavitalea antarctica]
MKKNNRVLFRADGNSTIGLGHIYRCLGLAEILKDHFHCRFLVCKPGASVRVLIEQHFELDILEKETPEEQLLEIAHKVLPDDIIVLDGYYFDLQYQTIIKLISSALVMLDDKADQQYVADLIINQGDESLRPRYKTGPHTAVLMGFDYTVVRPHFLSAASNTKITEKINSVFICMGGADPFNITVKAVRACIACEFIEAITIVVGSAYQNTIELESITHGAGGMKKITKLSNISAEQMVHHIYHSDIAISSASSIALEVCCVKSGLLTGTVADNQVAILKQLERKGCCVSVNDFNKVSEPDLTEYLQKMNNIELVNTIITNQARVFDGLSGTRLLAAFKALKSA